MAMKGARAHIRRLEALAGATTRKEIGAALFAAGELIQVEAQTSISRGSVSGRGHVPAPVGQPPNYNTGVLSDGIVTTQPGELRVRVSSEAPYAAYQEFGTSKMGARPYLRPARDKKKKDAQALVQQALNRANKRSRSSDQ